MKKEILTEKEKKIVRLQGATNLTEKDQGFAGDLIRKYANTGWLTDKQWYWVGELIKRDRNIIRQRSRATSDTYVYCISGGDSVKIGIAKDPRKRLNALQTGNANPLKILGTIKFPTKMQAKQKEAVLHKRLRRFRQEGEWFSSECLNRGCLKWARPPIDC